MSGLLTEIERFDHHLDFWPAGGRQSADGTVVIMSRVKLSEKLLSRPNEHSAA